MSRVKRYLRMNVLLIRVAKMQKSNPPQCETLPGAVIRKIAHNDLERAIVRPELDLSGRFAEAAFQRNDLAYGAFVDNRLIAYSWRATESAPDTDGFWIQVAKPYCYSYKSFTLPEYRGHRLMPLILRHLDQEFIGRGLTHRIAFVEAGNIASLRAGARAGSRQFGRIFMVRLRKRYCHFRSPSVRQTGLKFLVAGDKNLTRRPQG